MIGLRSNRAADPARSNERWFLAPVMAVETALAAAAAANPLTAGALVAAIVALAAAVLAPAVVMAAAFPATFGYWRVGPAAAGMSVADAVTILGALASIPYVPWRTPLMRQILLPFALYVGLLAVSVAAHPSTRTLTELGHRVLLVVGAMMIGAALANLGHTRLALRMLFAFASVVAAAAIVFTLTHRLAAAYPFGIQKNTSGSLLASCLVIAVSAGHLLELPRRWTIPLYAVISLGFLSSQSRGAMLALVAVLFVFVARHGRGRVRIWAPVLLGVTVVVLGLAATSYNERDLAVTSANAKYNSLNSRVDVYTYALENQFKPHPVVGAGMKWFKVGDSIANGPHNFVVAELSETGLIGLFGLLVFAGITLNSLRRRHGRTAEVAYLVLLERLLDSLLGIFWVAGTATLPFLVIGLAIGEEADRQAAAGRYSPASVERNRALAAAGVVVTPVLPSDRR